MRRARIDLFRLVKIGNIGRAKLDVGIMICLSLLTVDRHVLTYAMVEEFVSLPGPRALFRFRRIGGRDSAVK